MDISMLRRAARQMIDRIPLLVQPLLFVVLPAILLHPLWTSGAADAGAREQGRKFEPTRSQAPLLPPDVVRQSVEQDARFAEIKKAICPRRVPDRHEEIDRYPAIRILEGGQWVTVTDDSSRGMYEKVIEMTPDGRLELMNDLLDDANEYVFGIARRTYVQGSEVESPQNPNEVDVHFRWRWQPLNKPGGRFTLFPSTRADDSLNGTASFKRGPGGWEMVDLSLEDDGHDYMHAQ